MEFEPVIELSPDEAGMLAAIMSHPGFKVIQKICKSTVDQFAVAMLNADEADEKRILSLHRSAKVAAQLYTMQLNRMKNAVNDYIQSQPSDKPIDVAEALDIGAYTRVGEEEEESF